MKKIFAAVALWFKHHIRLRFSVKIYVFVNNKWINIDFWEFKKQLEAEKNGIGTGIEKVKFVDKKDNVYTSSAEELDFKDLI